MSGPDILYEEYYNLAKMHGMRDALHMPFVVAKGEGGGLTRCDWVTFTYPTQTNSDHPSAVKCEEDDSIGFVNPYTEYVPDGEHVIVFIHPNLVTKIRHQFDLNTKKHQTMLKALKAKQEEDPACAGCWNLQGGTRLYRD